MKIRIEKEVSIASAFTHLIAAWDVGPYSWYRKVEYSATGHNAIDGIEPRGPARLLATVIMQDPDDEVRTITERIDGRWIKRALELCISMDGPIAAEALKIINEDPAADQNTADLVMQVGAYGRVVFG